MKPTLRPGIRHQHVFKVPASKTVPALYPESEDFAAMPEVFATGFLVGFLEWACILAIKPHLDWPRELTLGTHVDVGEPVGAEPGEERKKKPQYQADANFHAFGLPKCAEELQLRRVRWV